MVLDYVLCFNILILSNTKFSHLIIYLFLITFHPYSPENYCEGLNEYLKNMCKSVSHDNQAGQLLTNYF